MKNGLIRAGVERLHRVRLPHQALGLVGAERWLDAPQVHAHAVGLCALDRGHHVLVAREQHRVGDRAVAGQRLQVGADLGVHALLLAAVVEVAQPQLDPGELGDHPLVDGRHAVARRVEPVDPQQLAPQPLGGHAPSACGSGPPCRPGTPAGWSRRAASRPRRRRDNRRPRALRTGS